MKLHLDTDIGSNPDDLCALAMVLHWPGAQLVGITTVSEHEGWRVDYAKHALELAGNADVPIAAGGGAAALDLLEQSISQGAVVVGLGPYTNLASLERRKPGILSHTRLFLMGGYVQPTPPGYPYYGRSQDTNVQSDVDSALFVIQNGGPTFVPLAVTVRCALRREQLPALRSAGPMGQLIAQEAEAFARTRNYEARYGVLLLLHDPLTCAIALGWDTGVEISTLTVRTELEDGLIQQTIADDGKPTRIVTNAAGDAFSDHWLNIVRTPG